eukprot:TRINITY_DN65673_c0_g1_i1.p1 TRINITY_DN65673_c0_g1~~TRINITY_DN65673_c0_g1_i1.p1  ORF type:complete len:722 (+),score=157.58 TRINITY_DN65673_c0_g1_i1:91-2256(+)
MFRDTQTSPRSAVPRSAIATGVAAVGTVLVWLHGRHSATLDMHGAPQPPAPGGPAPELPAGWVEFYDQRTSRAYYHNPALALTQWDRPVQREQVLLQRAVGGPPRAPEKVAETAAGGSATEGHSEWLKRLSAGLSATLYSGDSCSGESITYNLSRREPRCRSCLDTCQSNWESGKPMHGPGGPLVRSFQVHGSLGGLRTHHSCVGLFEYPGVEESIHTAKETRERDGCASVHGQAHFRLVLDTEAVPADHVKALRAAAEALDPPPPPPSKELAVVNVDGPEAPASRYQARDWFQPVLRKKDVLQNWTTRFVTPETKARERLVPCGNAEADAANAEGVAWVRAHLTYDTVPREVNDPAEAEPLFSKAAGLAPNCPTPRLNLAIVMLLRLRGANLGEGKAHAEEAAKLASGALRAKARLWVAIYDELRSATDQEGSSALGAEATRNYHAAFEGDDTLPLRFFGRPHKSWGTRGVPALPRLFMDSNTAHNRVASAAQERAMCKLLLYHEFAEYYGGHGSVQRSEAEGFLDRWSIHLPRLIPPYPLAALREAYRLLVAGKHLSWQGTTTPRLPENRWTQHNGPLARFSQAAILPRIESVAQRALMPTYAFMGSYIRGGGIIPHLDREVCEYTLTVTIDAHPYSGICPFGAAAEPNIIRETGYTDEPFVKNELPPEDKRVIIDSYVGDGGLVRGRGVVHWRPQNWEHNCTQFFLHFVLRTFQGSLN